MRFGVYFSYNQFIVFDTDVELPGCLWTDQHFDQGFARRESVVSVRTLLECGDAEVIVHRGGYEPHNDHQRVIAVPLQVTSGQVLVEGPEELDTSNIVALNPGHYRLTVAQQLVDADSELIELYFEPVAAALQASQIVVADKALRPPDRLLETAEVA